MVVLHAGPEGDEPCPALTAPCKPNVDYNLCQQYPEAHFAIWATAHFSNFLNFWKEAWDACRDLVDGLTGDLVKFFFRPRTPPTKLIMPLAIIGGVLSALTSFAPLKGGFAAAAVGAGVTSIVQGIITQDQLSRPDPLQVWQDIQPAATRVWGEIIQALEDYWKKKLASPMDYALGDLADDPGGMPNLLKGGAFAAQPVVKLFDTSTKGALASAAINALWIQDGATIIKLSDKAYGQGDGAACKAYPQYTVCMNGIAYVFIKWRNKEGRIDVDPGAKPLDPKQWDIWGAYDTGFEVEGEKNADHLKEYGITLEQIAKSAEKTQKDSGKFLFVDDGKSDAERVMNDPTNIDPQDLLHWSIPVCDIEAILAEGGFDHIDKKASLSARWIVSIPCTCLKAKGWPKEHYKDNDLQPQRKSCPGWAKK